MSDKIKIGVIGVGALGRHHARLYNMNDKVEVTGIYDVNPNVAFAVGEEFDFKIYRTIEELAEICDGLSIAVPSHLHHKISIPLLKAGKHLLIEKPIATTIRDAEEMVNLAKENNLVLGVGHVERFNPVMVFLEQLAEKARFLDVQRLAPYPPQRHGALPRGTEVSVILDLMIHDLELVLHLVDSEVEKIDANGLKAFSDTEDIVNARIQFKNGCIANINASRIAYKPVRRYNIFYTDAYLSLDYAKRTGVYHTKDEENLRVIRQPIPINDHNALEKELDDFASCIVEYNATGKAPLPRVCGQKAMNALKLALDIEQAVRLYNKKYSLN
jgi:predicted dehydrogenase